MSDIDDFSAFKAESEAAGANRSDFMGRTPPAKEKIMNMSQLEQDLQSLDGQTYPLGEVPQARLMDPKAFLPLNSDKLLGSTDVIQSILQETGVMIEDHVNRIEKIQKKIAFWENQIEKNKAAIQRNIGTIKQNNVDITYDKKNRDYWLGRAEQVELDFHNSEASNHESDWAWLIKKYGLKNSKGYEIDPKSNCVSEFCEGEIKNLAAEYKSSGAKYDQDKKNREEENTRFLRENGKLMKNNDVLRAYITNAYNDEIEPVQDGILLLKELSIKVKSLAQDSKRATYGDLRDWAEPFLNEFIQSNPKVIQEIVSDFRRLTSIPLPARNY